MSSAVCSIDGCDRPANVPGSARGWCRGHYKRWMRRGDPLAPAPPPKYPSICSIEGCGRPANVPGAARGWCVAHYKRWRKRGSPTSPTPLPKRRPAVDRFWTKVTQGEPDACWEWQGARDSLGYGFFRVTPGETMRRSHRVAWELTNGPILSGLLVCHQCDNPPCCNPAHLFLGTNADNMADRNHKGRTTKGRVLHCGESSGRSTKLTLAEVEAIVAAYAAGGISQESLGHLHGVSQTQIGRIIRGERWRVARQL